MKNIKLIYFFYGLLLIILPYVNANGQGSTYILIRHAEKDTSQAGSTMMQADPPLSAKGIQRAASLVKLLEAYPSAIIYSSNFIRTKSTVAPLCEKWGVQPVIYDHRKLDVLAAELLSIQNRIIVVVGHSNTTPALANLLIKEKKFESLDEAVYNKMFIIKYIDNKYVASIVDY